MSISWAKGLTVVQKGSAFKKEKERFSRI